MAWSQRQDEAGNCYWYNSVTQESTWDPGASRWPPPRGGWPREEQTGYGDWHQCPPQDEAGNWYWHNRVTGESTFDRPPSTNSARGAPAPRGRPPPRGPPPRGPAPRGPPPRSVAGRVRVASTP